MSRRWMGWVLVGLLVVTGVLAYSQLSRREPVVQAQLVGLATPDPGFQRVSGPQELLFPRDHGAHPDYQTEWWYYTGNLQSADGRRFGYQLTFFRRAMLSGAALPERESDWATGQVYLAHFAVTDVQANRFQSFERFMRGGGGLAGAESDPDFQVWLEDWSVEQVGPDEYRLRAYQAGLGLDLTLRDEKGPVLQGQQGYSRKGPQPGNASTYYSQTRLVSTGSVVVDDQEIAVSGSSWMDHEFSTSALSEGQTGWDWFALQMDDGTELMVFYIRRADGTIDPFSSGLWVAADGSTTLLASTDYTITPTATWTSPRSGGIYPAAWEISVPGVDLQIQVQPVIPDQEHNLAFIYWEGAVDIQGTRAGQPVGGVGYVELTGYVGSMAGQF